MFTVLIAQVPGSSLSIGSAYGFHFPLTFSHNNSPFATFTTVGSVVRIDGALELAGIEPFLSRAGDVYIVPKGSVSNGGVLMDIAGVPNTIISGIGGGLFLSELIGIVGSGNLVTGQYDVIVDEDQNGVFISGIDNFHTGPNGAINVILPANIPPLPPSVAQLKNDATNKKNNAITAAVTWEFILAMEQLNSQLGCISNPVGCFVGQFANAVTKYYQNFLMVQDPKVGASILLANNVGHWAGIEADPPDSNFMQLSPLEAVELIDPKSNVPLDVAYANAGNAIAVENALAEAALHSFERYQGADNGNNGQWALIHARATQNYASLLQEKLPFSNTALTELNTVVGALPSTFTDPIPDWEAFRSDVAMNGLSVPVQTELLALQLTGPDIIDLEASIGALDYSSFSLNDMVSANNAMIASNNQLVTTLGTLETDMATIISNLLAEGFTDVHPIADAGGPYSGTEGVPVTSFDGTGSSDPDNAIVLYEWDFDRDAVFGDATGPLPVFTFNQAFEGLVGLRVTDNDGNQGIDYAWIEIANSNSRPSIDTFNPPAPHEMELGDVLALSVTASDPDNDPFTIQWFVDDVIQQTGPNFNYQPTIPAEIGTPLIRVEVNDNQPTGGIVSKTWGVAVFAVNNPPIAIAGPDQMVTTSDTVNLDGSGSSDPDMNPLTFSWSMTVPPGSTAVLSNPTIVNPTFVADLPGDYVAELIVNDGNLDSTPDSVTITANFPSADLELTKTVDNPTPNVNDIIKFLITVTNNGPNTATGVMVVDPNLPPAGLTGVSVLFSGNGFNPVTGIWDVGTILSGQSETFEITGTVATTNPITNSAEVIASDQNDPDSTPDNQNAQEDDQATASTNTTGCTSDAECTDGLFCNGLETCDIPTGVCQPGTPPACDDSLFCNGLETCNETTDACDPGTSPACDDSLFCNGLETCNETTDACDPGTTVDPNDGVECTSDSCNEGTDSIDNTPNDALCDNGLFCDGAETCDVLADCQAGTAPADDDGVSCTDDSCNEDTDTVTNTANDANCDNGQICDGTETCDAVLDCQAGIATNIDDGIACTDDSCTDANGVQNTPNDANCNNGVVCDGVEICDTALDCQAGPPAQPGASCEDGDECTLLDTCDGAGGCASGQIDPNDLTCSPNGDPGPTQIGGEIIPIESTSLILAGAQSFSWMIPVVLSILGIGLFVVRKSENS